MRSSTPCAHSALARSKCRRRRKRYGARSIKPRLLSLAQYRARKKAPSSGAFHFVVSTCLLIFGHSSAFSVACALRATWMTVNARCSEFAQFGVPVSFQILDQCRTEVAISLFPCVGGEVAAKQVKRLLRDPKR